MGNNYNLLLAFISLTLTITLILFVVFYIKHNATSIDKQNNEHYTFNLGKSKKHNYSINSNKKMFFYWPTLDDPVNGPPVFNSI